MAAASEVLNLQSRNLFHRDTLLQLNAAAIDVRRPASRCDISDVAVNNWEVITVLEWSSTRAFLPAVRTDVGDVADLRNARKPGSLARIGPPRPIPGRLGHRRVGNRIEGVNGDRSEVAVSHRPSGQK